MSKIDKIKQESEEQFDEKFANVPAIAGQITDNDECCNCGEDLTLELYEAFSIGYKTIIDDIKSFLLSKLDLAYKAGQEEGYNKAISSIDLDINNSLLEKEARLAERKEIVGKIRLYIKDCHDKGYEMQTVVEHLDNEYILEDILEDENTI